MPTTPCSASFLSLPSNSGDKVCAVKRVAERAKHCFLFPIPAQHSCTSTRALPSPPSPLLSTDFIADSEKSNMQLRTEMAPLSPSLLSLSLSLSLVSELGTPRAALPFGRGRAGVVVVMVVAVPSHNKGTTRTAECWDSNQS